MRQAASAIPLSLGLLLWRESDLNSAPGTTAYQGHAYFEPLRTHAPLTRNNVQAYTRRSNNRRPR